MAREGAQNSSSWVIEALQWDVCNIFQAYGRSSQTRTQYLPLCEAVDVDIQIWEERRDTDLHIQHNGAHPWVNYQADFESSMDESGFL